MAAVAQPHSGGEHPGPDNVAQGGWDKVTHQEVVHRDIGEVHSQRNEEHICNAVLQPQCDESADRKPDAQQLPSWSLGGHRPGHGSAHQEVCPDGFQEDHAEAQGGLLHRQRGREGRRRGVGEGSPDQCQADAANEVAHEDGGPHLGQVSRRLVCGHRLRQEGHEAVHVAPGQQVSPVPCNQGEANRENESTQEQVKPWDRERNPRNLHHQGAPEGQEDPSHPAPHEHPGHRQVPHVHPLGADVNDHRIGLKHRRRANRGSHRARVRREGRGRIMRLRRALGVPAEGAGRGELEPGEGAHGRAKSMTGKCHGPDQPGGHHSGCGEGCGAGGSPEKRRQAGGGGSAEHRREFLGGVRFLAW
eukprot:RCo033780